MAVVVKPRDSADCLNFIANNKSALLAGQYDLRIEMAWIKELDAETPAFLARYCPQTHSVLAQSLDTPKEVFPFLLMNGPLSIRQYIAANRSAPDHILETLAADTQVSVRRKVAANHCAPAIVLDRLARDVDTEVRCYVARHLNTSSQALHLLMTDPKSQVRQCVAQNPGIPLQFYEILAYDIEADVRREVASNPNTFQEVLETLAGDTDFTIRNGVAMHPRAPVDLLTRLAYDEDFIVRASIAARLDAPLSLLEHLAHDPLPPVRRKVASNPVVPASILEYLAQDSDPDVYWLATHHPHAPDHVKQQVAQNSPDPKKFWKKALAELNDSASIPPAPTTWWTRLQQWFRNRAFDIKRTINNWRQDLPLMRFLICWAVPSFLLVPAIVLLGAFGSGALLSALFLPAAYLLLVNHDITIKCVLVWAGIALPVCIILRMWYLFGEVFLVVILTFGLYDGLTRFFIPHLYKGTKPVSYFWSSVTTPTYTGSVPEAVMRLPPEDSLHQKLLTRARGDQKLVERLIKYEQERAPEAGQWERDNR